MTSQVTQCPSCHTSFRVTEAQLGIANGAVRCGSCLHIFKAPEHWLNNPQPAAPAETSLFEEEPSNAPAAASSPDYEDLFNDDPEQDGMDNIFDDDMFADDDFDLLADSSSDEPVQDVSTGEDLPPDDTNELEDTNNEDSPTFAPEPEVDVESKPDEALALAESQGDDEDDYLISDSIINTDLDLEIEPNINSEEEFGFSDSFLQLNEGKPESSSLFKELDDLGGDEESIQEDAWARKLLEEDEPKYEEPAADEQPEELADDAFSDLFDALEDDQPAMDNELQDILNDRSDEGYELEHEDSEQSLEEPASLVEEEFVLGNESLMAGERIGQHHGNHNSLLHAIESEPVIMAMPTDHSRWVKRAWVSSIVIALLMFAAQYLIFNFDRLARDPDYRPLLTTACDTIGCKIPSLDDINSILSSNLMVRSHPNAQQALVVDAIIINRADFKQRFPIMELQFTDLDGDIVAGRQFSPSEYLAGELSGDELMPMKQPVHISLEIVDPGEQAVNYQLRFHPHQGS
ncbi:DUF3426 domain-containing protein [Oceanicoccus sp. KOV_DT_Chl]|uniref:DUF3426 domain-containing protein n=1 Tax=Oceanicoccus sp. KOV_DT_Chl TaxID=1904639 RepID=UPI000C7C692C|nr:DUF3426 domain-containing protein [Oceanicoccus sp. KOV_DT_Chl]